MFTAALDLDGLADDDVLSIHSKLILVPPNPSLFVIHSTNGRLNAIESHGEGTEHPFIFTLTLDHAGHNSVFSLYRLHFQPGLRALEFVEGFRELEDGPVTSTGEVTYVDEAEV